MFARLKIFFQSFFPDEKKSTVQRPSVSRKNQLDVLLRCETDLPPAAGFFWFCACAPQDLSSWLQKLVEQSPSETDWWALHSKDTVWGWLDSIDLQLHGDVNFERPVWFENDPIKSGIEGDQLASISVIAPLFFSEFGNLGASLVRLMQAYTKEPDFLNEDSMAIPDGFLQVQTMDIPCGFFRVQTIKQPMGCWMPMVQDQKGRFHDMLDLCFYNHENLSPALSLLMIAESVSEIVKSSYLARQMVRYHDLGEAFWKSPNAKFRSATCTRSFLEAGAKISAGSWSCPEKKQSRRMLIDELGTASRLKISDQSTVVLIKNLVSQGHDVVLDGHLDRPFDYQHPLWCFASAQMLETVALLLRLGANPESMTFTSQGPMTLSQAIKNLNNPAMESLFASKNARSAAHALLADM